MIAPAFAPHFFSEALVNSKLALAMLRAGWDVVVLAARSDGVVYSEGWDEPWRPLQRVCVEVTSPKGGGRLKRILSKAQAVIRAGHPITGALWSATVARDALRFHAERPFDVILTRSTSCIAHLPALLIRREARIPWIANWNDPPAYLKPDIFREGVALWKRLAHLRYLRAAAREADWNTFPSKRLREYMIDALQIAESNRAVVVPHVGIDLPQDLLTVQRNPSDFIVTHAGAMMPEHEPHELFSAWARFAGRHPEARLRLIGHNAAAVREIAKATGAHTNVDFCAPMPFLDTLRALARSNAQLLIDVRYHGTLMLSKIPDYAAVGQPIIAVAPRDSTTRELMERHKAGLYAANDSVDEIELALERAYEESATTDSTTQSTERLWKYCSPQSILDEIEKCLSTPPRRA